MGGYTLPSNTTDFHLSTGGCPAPGEYELGNLIIGCDSNYVYLIAGDHTDLIRYASDGNVMFVNAQPVSWHNPQYVLKDSIYGLCSGITYQFAAYIANVMKSTGCGGYPASPNLTLAITDTKGNVLASYNTGDIPEQPYIVWTQYGCSFTAAPGQETVAITITSNNKGSCGNYFLLDDVTMQACGSNVTASLDGSNTVLLMFAKAMQTLFCLPRPTAA